MTNLKIKPFISRLIQENILYIITCIFLVAIIGIVINISINKLLKLDKDNEKISKEVVELRNRFNLLNTAIPSTQELEQNIKILNGLIPNMEDHFSIIYTLDKLSQKTGFIITSYSVNMKASTTNKLKLTITGIGDTSAFMNFLESYNFGGGRLITSDKIELNSKVGKTIKIDLTFYNKKVGTDYNQKLVINEKIFKEIETLKTRVDFNFDEVIPQENNLDLDYPKKTTLF